jgi:hypothetical protein
MAETIPEGYEWISEENFRGTIKAVLAMAANKTVNRATKSYINELNLDPSEFGKIQNLIDRGIRVKSIPRKNDIANFILKKSSEFRLDRAHTEADVKDKRRRDLNDAVLSILKLTIDADRISTSSGTKTIKVTHFREAYDKNYCAIWPVC